MCIRDRLYTVNIGNKSRISDMEDNILGVFNGILQLIPPTYRDATPFTAGSTTMVVRGTYES